VFQATEVIAFNRCTNFIDRTLGAIGSSYDLETIIEVAARWKAEDIFPFQIHFAGDSTQSVALEAKCKQLALTTWKRHSCRFTVLSEAARPSASRTGLDETSAKSVASTLKQPTTPLPGEEGVRRARWCSANFQLSTLKCELR
jgi:hypothetical protein